MKDYTDIVIILDKSGSMSPIKNDTIGGLNEFIKEQQKLGGNARLTVVLFDTRHTVLFEELPIMQVRPITEEQYRPDGGTALVDAMGDTLTRLSRKRDNMKHGEVSNKVLIAVMTDGEENSSIKYTRREVFRMIESYKREDLWEFVFLGANQDAIAEANNYGIDKNHSINFTATSKGITDSYTVLNATVSNYRNTGTIGNFMEADNVDGSIDVFTTSNTAGWNGTHITGETINSNTVVQDVDNTKNSQELFYDEIEAVFSNKN